MDTKPLTPFFKSRQFSNPSNVKTIVLHASGGGSLDGAVETLRENGYGYHYLIDKKGVVYKGAKTSSRLSHAGVSVGPQGSGCNEYSLGICFINWDGCQVIGKEYKFTGKVDPYTQEQLASARLLLVELKKAMPQLQYLTTHKIVAPTRKVDPFGLTQSQIIELAQASGLTTWGRHSN